MKELKWKKFKVLDDGFVCLVDVMGDDYSVVQAARVSYGEGTKKVSSDRNLIRYLMRHMHCYDCNTEVLTDSGFKRWPDVIDGDKLGIWDPNLESLCYESPEYLTCDQYEGPMYRVDHGGVSLLVTPEHSMWVKRKSWSSNESQTIWDDNYELVSAERLNHRSMVRYSKIAPLKDGKLFSGEFLPPNDSPQDLLRFIGFFIGDGNAGKTSANLVTFHLKKARKINYLKELCLLLGWLWKRGSDNNYYVYADGLGHQFRRLFYKDKQKWIPDFLCHLNQKDALALLDGFRNSDGSTKRSTWEYTTSVYHVAERVQWIALHAGEAAHIGTRCSGMYSVMFLSRMREPVINQGKRNTTWENYQGKVYCAKTRTGILVIRREGKIVLSGNTTPFEMAELKFLVRVPMDTWRQWIRHRTASTNEYSTRYSIAIDAAQRTPAGEWRFQGKGNRQGSEGNLDVKLGDDFTRQEASLQDQQRAHYERMLEAGVAREQARKDLPLSTYTEAYWKIDLKNLLGFLFLRMDDHAQKEIRDYATTIGEQIVKPLFPIVWEAFQDYRVNAMQLTALDVGVIQRLIAYRHFATALREELYSEDEFIACQDPTWKGLKRSRERDECRLKLQRLEMMASPSI